jgi:Protein of unknown function (DUF998)
VFAIPLAAAAYLTLASVILAAPRRDYSHVRSTLSELGAWGAPRARVAAWGVFFPLGFVLAGLAACAYARAPGAAWLATCLSVGYLGAALFPCDPGAPLFGSWRQQLHSLSGAIEYLGGAFALAWLAALHDSPRYLALACVVLAAALGLCFSRLARVRGFMQRAGELALFAGLALLLA